MLGHNLPKHVVETDIKEMSVHMYRKDWMNDGVLDTCIHINIQKLLFQFA